MDAICEIIVKWFREKMVNFRKKSELTYLHEISYILTIRSVFKLDWVFE